MGTEAAPFMFGPPFLVCIALLLIFILGEHKRSDRADRVLGLGRGRIAKGYFGALAVLLIVCAWVAFTEHEPEMVVLYFIVFAVVLVIFLTVVVLPILALLRRFGFASMLGVTCSGIALAIAVGALMGGEVVASALMGAATSVAFCVAAGLPLVRSSRHVA